MHFGWYMVFIVSFFFRRTLFPSDLKVRYFNGTVCIKTDFLKAEFSKKELDIFQDYFSESYFFIHGEKASVGIIQLIAFIFILDGKGLTPKGFFSLSYNLCTTMTREFFFFVGFKQTINFAENQISFILLC